MIQRFQDNTPIGINLARNLSPYLHYIMKHKPLNPRQFKKYRLNRSGYSQGFFTVSSNPESHIHTEDVNSD